MKRLRILWLQIKHRTVGLSGSEGSELAYWITRNVKESALDRELEREMRNE